MRDNVSPRTQPNPTLTLSHGPRTCPLWTPSPTEEECTVRGALCAGKRTHRPSLSLTSNLETGGTVLPYSLLPCIHPYTFNPSTPVLYFSGETFTSWEPIDRLKAGTPAPSILY
jgi:hypothetical protein